MSYKHCHLVEEAEKWEAKLPAGPMHHQAGGPGRTSPLTGGGHSETQS